MAAAALLARFCLAPPALATEPQLELLDCPSVSPTVTAELLAIELRTLGIARRKMHWVIRCQGKRADIELRETMETERSGTAPNHAPTSADNDQVVERSGTAPNHAPTSADNDQVVERSGTAPNHAPTSGDNDAVVEHTGAPPRFNYARTQLDLSSTEEAAWPRLIALAATELAEQSTAAPIRPPLQTHALSPRVWMVHFDVQPKRVRSTELALGISLSRLGTPGAWLIGPTLGGDLRLGKVGLVGTELRAQWGHSAHSDVEVSWRLLSFAAAAGGAWKLGGIEAIALAGLRVGQLKLAGEADTVDASGRALVGLTGGPLVGLRLQAVPVEDVFVGMNLETGYALWPVKGTYDGGPSLVTVEALWTSATMRIGWTF